MLVCVHIKKPIKHGRMCTLTPQHKLFNSLLSFFSIHFSVFFILFFCFRRKAINKPSNRQMEILIDFMGRHQNLFNDSSDISEDLWEVLLSHLNRVEGAEKSIKQWRRVRSFYNYTLMYPIIYKLLPFSFFQDYSVSLLLQFSHFPAKLLCLSSASLLSCSTSSLLSLSSPLILLSRFAVLIIIIIITNSYVIFYRHGQI